MGWEQKYFRKHIMIPPFHLAIPVDDLDAARDFYVKLLGCSIGRTDKKWIDFNFYGHQLVAHLATPIAKLVDENGVDGDNVPAFHFGVILEWAQWEKLAEKLTSENITFIIKPRIRFKGKAGEQGTMFFRDPAGNAIEVKSFKDMSQIFAT